MLGMWWSWILVVAGICAVAWIATRVASGSKAHSRAIRSGKSPEEVLRDRFARGEIDEDEYQTRMNVLRHG